MPEVLLLEVNLENEGFHLSLMDGSKWFVNPGDLPTVATWLPTTKIRIEDGLDGSTFPYILTNIEDAISIRAMRL